MNKRGDHNLMDLIIDNFNYLYFAFFSDYLQKVKMMYYYEQTKSA